MMSSAFSQPGEGAVQVPGGRPDHPHAMVSNQTIDAGSNEQPVAGGRPDRHS